MAKGQKETLDPVTNGAAAQIAMSEPYSTKITIEGTTHMIFHRWNVESVAEKAGAAKGSKAKKTDDLESYVWRNAQGELCLPGEYLRQSIIHAAKFAQDPRSPRKSAMDLFKAGILVETELAPLGSTDWDFVDQRRVTVQRAGITRCRPAMLKGWRAMIELTVILPEYISKTMLQLVLQNAGRLVGVGDNRPSYGRFTVVGFD